MFRIANWFCLAVMLLLSACVLPMQAATEYNITWYHQVSFDHWRGVRDLKVGAGVLTFTDPRTWKKVTIPSTYTPVSQETDGCGRREIRFYKPAGSYLPWTDYKDLKIDSSEYRFTDRNGKQVILIGTVVVEEN